MKMTSTVKRVLMGLAVCSAGFAAHADVLYSFDSTEVAAYGAGPYGTVRLHDNGSGGIDFTVTLRSDLDFVNTGGPHSIFAFNSSGVATSDISGIKFNGVAAGAGYTVVTSGGNQPFGTTFSLAIDCTGTNAQCPQGGSSGGPQADPLTFTVANAVYSDFGFLVTGTTAYFASDVMCRTGSCASSTGAIGVTHAGSTVPPLDQGGTAPEPGGLALAGLGLFGLWVSRRRMA